MGAKKQSHNSSASKPSKLMKKLQQNSLLIKVSNHLNKIYLALAFLIPFLFFGTALALKGVYPFGDHQILVVDFWQQYYPFYVDYQSKLQEGSSLLYSWGIGLGANNLALAAYYLASPLNLLTVFFPQEWLREVVTFLLVVKIGLTGLFTYLFLRYTFKKTEFITVIFSSMFALCAFAMGYYWNVIWMDTFALFPLVVLGTVALVKEGKFKLYIISLALAIISNYYIGLFLCIFTIFVFATTCICTKLSIKDMLKKTGKMIVCTAVSLGLTAFITLPAYFNLKITYSSNNAFPSEWKLENPFIDVFGNFTAFNHPSTKEGLPNLYCGLICVILIGVYLLCKNIPIREKICSISVLAFLILSVNLNVLDYIWHGFHETNMIPYRFSFLISFILVVLAYRAYMYIEQINFVDIGFIAVITTIIIICSSMNEDHEKGLIGNVIVAVVVLLAMVFFVIKAFNKRTLSVIICLVALVELFASPILGIDAVSVTTRSTYPDKLNAIHETQDYIKSQDSEKFFRSEFTCFYTVNDPALYGYNGTSEFSSTINVNITNFMEKIGLMGWPAGNRYGFAETTPLTHAFLDIKYLMAKNGHISDLVNWRPYYVSDIDNIKSYKNNKYLSLGFMTNKDLLTLSATKENPFKTQQDIFTKSTGLTDELFQMVNVATAGHKNANVSYSSTDASGAGIYGHYSYSPINTSQVTNLNWNYTMPKDGTLYAYSTITNAENMTVSGSNGSMSYNIKRPYISSIGTFKKGETVAISASPTIGMSGSATLYVGMLNQDLFDKGYELLNDEKMNVETFDTTYIKGSVNVKQDGLLYTSIPYEKGWSVYVDGEQKELKSIETAMSVVELEKGQHVVEFKYSPEGFIPGLTISIVSLLGLVGLILFVKFNKKKKVIVDEKEKSVKAK